jgi:hypothetical protein
MPKFKKAEDSMASSVFAGLPKFGEIHADQRSSRGMRNVVSVAFQATALAAARTGRGRRNNGFWKFPTESPIAVQPVKRDPSAARQ